MKLSYHYMLMTNHMLLQKRLLSGLKDTGLTAGSRKCWITCRIMTGQIRRRSPQAAGSRPDP